MRWLLKYPITAEEVIHELDSIQETVGPDSPVGGVGPMIRHHIKTFLEQPDNMARLLEDLKIK